MARKTIKTWVLATLTTDAGLSTAELVHQADGEYTFGQILTQLNRLLLDKAVVAAGEDPIKWRKPKL